MTSVELPKLAIVHVETMASATQDVDEVATKMGDGPEILESSFAHVDFFRLVRLFWRVNLIAVLSLSGALFDGAPTFPFL